MTDTKLQSKMAGTPERPSPSDSGDDVTFTRTLGFFDATMIGVGAMIGAGIFVLTGIACGEAGPAAILAFALNGVVTLITAMVYAELSSSIPKAGGGYAYVKHAFPDILGFTAGWWLWFAYTVACALYAAGFGSYFMEFLFRYFPGTAHLMTSVAGEHAAVIFWIILSGASFTLLNMKGAAVTGKTENILVIAKIAVLIMFIIFGIEAFASDIPAARREFTPFFPKGFNGVFIAMGLTFIAFEGYDLIATVAEEIKNPGKTIPRATFASVGITVFVYLCVLLVSLGAVHPEDMTSWEFLGKYQETAIVRASAKMMPGVGVFLIVLGGVLSTISALNATVLASSRVAFSMARDGWLPSQVATIHPKKRTPHIAILVTGAIFVVIAVALPVNALGSAASIMFLLVFAFVNLALIALRRKAPKLIRPYRIPLYPVLPIGGFVINLLLALYQLAFDPVPWLFVIGWTVFGLVLYFAVFEKKLRHKKPQTLELHSPLHETLYNRFTIVVPLSNPHTVTALIDMAAALARQKNGVVVGLTVVQVPRQLPIHEGVKMAHHARPLLRIAQKRAEELGVDFVSDLRLGHNASTAIIDAVKGISANMLVMGWKGFANTRDRIFGQITDHMIRHCPCDLALARVGDSTGKRILLATSGGPNATLGADFSNGFSQLFNATVDACVVVKRHASKDDQAAALDRIENSIAALQLEGTTGTHIVLSDSVAAGIAKAARNYDLVVIGAAPPQFFKHMLLGDIPEKVARYARSPVIIIRKWQGPVSGLFRKLFG